MKPWLIFIVVCLCAALLCACGAGAEAENPAAQAPKAPAGEEIDAGTFTVLVPKGWERMDIDGGVQLYKGSLIFQMTVRGYNVTPEEDLALLQSLADQYGGEIEETQLLGMSFQRLYYTAAGVDQVYYSAVKDGEQIHIQLAGSGFSDNADLAAMLNSVQLK